MYSLIVWNFEKMQTYGGKWIFFMELHMQSIDLHLRKHYVLFCKLYSINMKKLML